MLLIYKGLFKTLIQLSCVLFLVSPIIAFVEKNNITAHTPHKRLVEMTSDHPNTLCTFIILCIWQSYLSAK